mmetsp:Transcript_43766/g.101172  ORF Transcript_43766/g.101172 Transcript_43766/m.101172 type:complete len:268 (-) Transcript_43766:188-991(-)
MGSSTRGRHMRPAGMLMLAALCLLALGGMHARAEDATEGEAGSDYASQFEGEDDKPKKVTAHPDVKATHVFPDFAKPRFPMGENVDVLVALLNTGSKTFNLTSVAGTLHPPFNFNFVVQNFTSTAIGQTLAPNEQKTVVYKFTPDGRLEALDFKLHLYVTYEDEAGEKFVHTLFNETATLIESASETSSKIMFVIMLVAVSLGLAALKGYTYYQKHEKKKNKRAAAAKPVEATKPSADEWLAGMPGMGSKKEKAPKGASKPKSKKAD